MEPFEGYKGISPEERYRNEMLYHARKHTELLEQIAQLLQHSEQKVKRPYTRSEKK